MGNHACTPHGLNRDFNELGVDALCAHQNKQFNPAEVIQLQL